MLYFSSFDDAERPVFTAYTETLHVSKYHKKEKKMKIQLTHIQAANEKKSIKLAFPSSAIIIAFPLLR